MTWLTLSVILLCAGAAAVVSLSLCYRKVGPNEVLIVSGRRGQYTDAATGEVVEKSFRVYHGGGALVLPVLERVHRMSVELMTLELRTPEFFTKFAVPIVVDAIAQIKVLSDDPAATATAAEMFLSKTEAEMNEIAHQMMQGHLRAVISTMPFEEIHANPEAFARTVQRLTAADLANMGIQVVSFTIREVRDPSGYLQALGRPQLAEVQKQAVLGEANAQRDATVGKSVADREASVSAAKAREQSKCAEIDAELAIASADAARDVRKHELAARVAEARALSELAYETKLTHGRQTLVEEQLGVSKIEREKHIELETLEVARRERELDHSVRRPAEAERYRQQLLLQVEAERTRALAEAAAEAERMRGAAHAEVTLAEGKARAEAVRLERLAEADGLAAKLHAETEAMQRKAEAWQHYSPAALAELLIDRLPAVAEAVAKPLSQIDRIVLVDHGGASADGSGASASSGVERVARGVTNVMAQLPAVMATMTGVDLQQLLGELPKRAAAKPALPAAAGTSGKNGEADVALPTDEGVMIA
ncbi:MAG: hypothetical protein KC503_02985 [Myxococcales bacterium]|nr:hypothetical protein [Myxococcales bacterium]